MIIKRMSIILHKNWKYIFMFISMILFLAIVEDVFENEIMKIDVFAYNLFVNTLRSDILTPFMIFITNLGSPVVLIGICIITLIILKNKKIGVSISFNLLLVSLLNILLKNIVQRPRPTDYRLIEEAGYSFPSGHSMISMAFYGFIIFLIFRYVKNKKMKYFLGILLSFIIVLIGISRIYLGVHYASDVVAGFLISISYLFVFTTVIFKINNYVKCKEIFNRKVFIKND